MGESDVIDRAAFDALLDQVGGDQEFLDELLATYFEDSPKLLDTLHTSLATGNAAEFRRAAHSLKSTSAGMGATALAVMCKELEDMGKAGAFDGAEARLDRTEEEYARVRVALAAVTAR